MTTLALDFGSSLARFVATQNAEPMVIEDWVAIEFFVEDTKERQQINHLRALEGEIARTIRSVSRIKQARVHLVLPERQLFSRDRQEPSASIVVSLQGRRGLDQQQVVAIQQIVSAAVPGLKPEKVSIVDNAGNLLARSLDRNDTKQLGNTAQELQANYEGRMARMIEEMLGRSLGPGNVRAQVTAEMDFDRVTENSEIFDPDGQVVRSTQTVEESTSESDSQPSGVTVGSNLPGAEIPQLDEGGGSNAQSTRTEETVNFDISRTTRTHIRETGAVRRISVAVMVNGRTVEDANGNSQYEPRSQAEMDQIAAVVRSAVGLDESRGDRIEVVNMPFTEIAPVSEFEAPGLFGIEMADLMRLAEVLVLGILAVLVVIFVVRPMIVRLMAADNLALEGAGVGSLPGGPAMAAALGGPDGDIEAALQDGSIPPARRLPRSDQSRSVAEEIEQMIDINKIEGRVRASSVRKIGEIIQKHPEEAVGIIRNWLYQDA